MGTWEPEKMRHVVFSGIRASKERASKLEQQGIRVIHFDIGQPDFDTPSHIREAAKKALDDGQTGYTSNWGILPLRKAIAEKLNKENGLNMDAENIIVACGGQEALGAAMMALLDVGDEVLIPSPSYIAYENQARLANAVPVLVPLREEDNYNFDMEQLEKSITEKTKMLVFCNPGNPTGTIMDRKNLEKLAEICIRHNLLVVSDEAYEKIVYDDAECISLASLPGMAERTIVVQSFSKSDSMCGWRVAYLAAPKELANIIIRAHIYMTTHANSIAQYAALAALTGPVDEREAMLTEFDRRRKYLVEKLTELRIPFNIPQGAFYMFPNVGEFGMDGREFSYRLLDEAYVAVVPGDVFGECAKNNIRLSYATSMEECIEGMGRFQKFVEKLRGEK